MPRIPELQSDSAGDTPTEKPTTTHAPTAGRFGQPPRVWNIAFTDLWERFSYYSLQGLLAFYLLYSLDKGGLALDPVIATGIVGVYGAFTQLFQVIGSWLADRLVSPRTLVMVGAILITAGHASLAIFPGLVGLFTGLTLVILGTGALKTPLTTILGMLYAGAEDRRDAGFTIYFSATNTGAVLGPLLAGVAQSEWGFHAGFALAAFGMIAGLIQFSTVYSKLPEEASIVPRPLRREEWRKVAIVLAGVVAVVAVLGAAGRLDSDNLSTTTGFVLVATIACYFAMMLRSKQVTSAEKVRLRALIPTSIVSMIFFGFSLQVFTTVPVFIGKSVNTSIGSWNIPDVWFVIASGIAFVVVSPLVSALWTKMGPNQPGAMTKMAIAFAVISLGYLGLAYTAAAFGQGQIPALLVIVFLGVTGIAEIFIGPIILAVGTKAMPAAFKNQGLAMMALSIGGGSVISGILGGYFTKMSELSFFLLLTALAVVVSVALFAISRPITRALNTFD